MTGNKRTIMHLVHRLTFGGAERVLVNYLNGSQLHSHVVCSFFPPDSFIDEIVNKEVRIVHLDKKTGNDASIPFKLAKICREFNVGVIHCQGWGTYLEGLICAKFMKRGVKFVFAFHGKTISDLEALPWRRILTQRVGAVLGDAVITPSEDMRLDYAKTVGIDKKKITVMYNGVDTSLFSPEVKGTKIREEFGFGEKDIVLGCVARLDPVKNFPGLIKAFDSALKRGMNAKLLVVGDGPMMTQLRNLVFELGREGVVFFAGRRTDVPQCLCAMDFYVQASFYEGFSMTILEAMSTGLPVIAYDVGGTHEILQDGRNGVLLPADAVENHHPLAEAMMDIAQNNRKRMEMGKNGRNIVERFFSLKAMNAAYDRFFLTV